jgi:glutaredoxin-like protein
MRGDYVSIQIDEEIKQQLRRAFAKLVTPVKLVFFTQRNSCPACEQQRKLLEEVASLSDNITLQVFDLVLHGDQSRTYRITKIPATAVIGEKDYGIRFYGVTAGYEFTSLLETIVMVSAGTSGLDLRLKAVVRGIREPVHLQVMVTLTCPFCPRMVLVANQLALINYNIRSDMVESSEYPHLVQRYNVTGMPKTIINETHSFEGAVSADAVYVEILEAVNPEEYRRLEETIREAQGIRNVRNADENHGYDILIVGG